LFDADARVGKASVYLPDALERKYANAATEWAWQYLFPSGSLSRDSRGGVERRHHIDEKLLQRTMKKAVQASGMTKLATPIRCAIRSRPICSIRGTTAARCRSCSTTRMYRRR